MCHFLLKEKETPQTDKLFTEGYLDSKSELKPERVPERVPAPLSYKYQNELARVSFLWSLGSLVKG